MAEYKYSYQGDLKKVAIASSTNLAISLKKTVELSKMLKGKNVTTAIDFLEKVIEQKAVVPYKKYRAEMAHKRGKGIDTGGYPIKVAKDILTLVKSAKSNAKEKELGDSLKIISVSCRKGYSRYHYGRYSGRKIKSTTVEVIIGPKSIKKSVVGGKK